MAGTLGSLTVSLGLDAAEFTQGLDKAAYQAKQFRDRATKHIDDVSASMTFLKSAVVSAVGAFSVSVFAGLFTDAIKAAAALDDVAEKTGVSVEELSKLQEVARVGGHDFSAMTSVMVKLNKSLAEIHDPASQVVKDFAAIGLKASDLEGLDAGQALQKIAQSFAGFSDAGPGKSAIALRLMGKAAAEALPFIKDLGEGTDNITKVTREQAAQAEELEKDLKRLNTAKQDIIRTISFAFIPALDGLVKAFLDARKEAGGFKAAVDGLAADGSLERWFQDLALFIATTSDEFNGLIGLFEKAKNLANAATGQFTAIGGGAVNALKRDASDVEGAIADLKAGYAKATAIHDQYIADNTKKESNYSRVKKQFADQAARAAAPFPPRPDKPILNAGPSGGAGRGGGVDDPRKKQLEGQIAAIQAALASEQRILSARDEFLAAYYAQGYLSVTDYYDKKQQTITEDLAAQRKAYAEEAALLQARIALPSKGKGGISETDREDAINKLAKATEKFGIAQQDAAKKGSLAWFQLQAALEQYKAQLVEIDARTLDLAGDTAKATSIRFESQNIGFRRTLSNDPSAEARVAEKQLTALGKQSVLQAELNDRTSVYNRILGEVDTAQARINLGVQTGAITELQAYGERTKASQKRLTELTAEVAKAQEIAEKMAPGEAQKRALAGIDQMKLKMEELAAVADELNKKFRDVFADNFSGFLADVATGAKTIKDAFNDLVKSVTKSLADIASKEVAQQIFGKGGFLGGGKDGTGFDLGGMFGKMFGGGGAAAGGTGAEAALAAVGVSGTTANVALTAVGVSSTTLDVALLSLATSAQTAATALASMSTSSSASGLGSLFGDGSSGAGGYGAFDAVAGFARGGRPPIGKSVMVGERGPEMFRTNAAGRIVSNEELTAKRSEKRAIQLSVNVLPGATSASANQAALAMTRQLQKAARYA